MPAVDAVNHWCSPGTSLCAPHREPCSAPQSGAELILPPITSPGFCFPATNYGRTGATHNTEFSSPLHTGAGECPPLDWISPLPCLRALQLETVISALEVIVLGIRGCRSPAHREHVSLPKPPSSGPLPHPQVAQSCRGPLSSPTLP